MCRAFLVSENFLPIDAEETRPFRIEIDGDRRLLIENVRREVEMIFGNRFQTDLQQQILRPFVKFSSNYFSILLTSSRKTFGHLKNERARALNDVREGAEIRK